MMETARDNRDNVTPVDITERMMFTANTELSPSPALSQDEEVIKARGRRSVPLIYSPDVTSCSSPVRTKSSSKTVTSCRLLLPPTRCSPRKRLRLQDSPPARSERSPVISSLYSPSPDKLRRSPVSKRLRLSPALTDNLVPSLGLRALSQGQLTSLISDILARHPYMRQEVLASLPTPDLTHHEDNLSFLKKNIFKALPTTRLEPKTDSFAYNRVSVHLLSFKKSLSEGLKTLVESQHWVSTVDYVIMAWSYVRSTPVWSNPSHNTIRKTCFKTLSLGCLRALKEGNFSAEQCAKIRSKIEALKSDSDEILVCTKYIDFIIKNSNNDG